MQWLLISREMSRLLQIALAGCCALLQPGKSKFQAYSGLLVLNTGLWMHFQKQPFYHDDADELEGYNLMITQVAYNWQKCCLVRLMCRVQWLDWRLVKI